MIKPNAMCLTVTTSKMKTKNALVRRPHPTPGEHLAKDRVRQGQVKICQGGIPAYGVMKTPSKSY